MELRRVELGRRASLRRSLGAVATAGAVAAAVIAPATAAAHPNRHSRGRSASAFAGATAGNQTDAVKSGATSVKVSCPKGTAKHCAVKLTLRAKGVKGTLGTGSATISPGKMGIVHVKLSTPAIKAVKHAKGRQLSVEAVVASTDGKGAKATKTGKITLSGGKKEESSSLY